MNVIRSSFCESCRGLIVLPCISRNGEFCPLVVEFYPFVRIDSDLWKIVSLQRKILSHQRIRLSEIPSFKWIISY